MNTALRTPAFLAFIVLLIAAVSGCGDSSGPDDPDASPTPSPALNIVTTIYPVTYFSEQVGGERVRVQSVVRPGVDAHDFEPTPGDIRLIGQTDVLVYVHPNFESWVADAIDAVGGGLTVVETGELEGHEPEEGEGHDHEGEDPHTWLSPVEAVEQVRKIEAAFAMADPEGSDLYTQNADTLVTELMALDSEFTSGLASCSLDTVVVSHEAYGHLAERYGLEQLGLADLSGEFESSPGRVAEIINRMEELEVRHILQEPIASDDLASTVAAETGAEILPLHPLESLTPEELAAGETYFTVMRKNLESLRTALGCG